MKIRVLHQYYGCETGCCGHVVEIDDKIIPGSFDFFCPDEHDIKHDPNLLKDLVWKYIPEECRDTIDWSSIEFEKCPNL